MLNSSAPSLQKRPFRLSEPSVCLSDPYKATLCTWLSIILLSHYQHTYKCVLNIVYAPYRFAVHNYYKITQPVCVSGNTGGVGHEISGTLRHAHARIYPRGTTMSTRSRHKKKKKQQMQTWHG